MSETKLQSTRDVKFVSDGYHTFDELYQHRQLLYFAFARFSGFKCRWKPHYPGWPVLFVEIPSQQISYHFEERWLPLVKSFATEDNSIEWDGHTSDDVLRRLEASIWHADFILDNTRHPTISEDNKCQKASNS